MANLKIQGITPAAGKIKVGSSDVSKIYKGSTVVWPISSDIPVDVCNIEWDEVNSSLTQLIAGGNIPILNSSSAWKTAWDNETPAACYVNFDANNSSYGLLYNYFAKDTIQPPTGYRLPSQSDFAALTSAPCYTGLGNYNRYGANPGNWDLSVLTDTTELGDSGFNSQGYGSGFLNISSGVLSFINVGTGELYWNNSPDGISAAQGFLVSSVNGYLQGSTASAGNRRAHFIRFVKI